MRRVLGGVGSALGLVLAIGWFGLLVLIEIGGISYRKDCVNREGKVEKSWTVTWYMPIPFVFRPSEEGCEVHTGVRVAMNAVGLFPFKEFNVADAAREAADNPGLPEGQRYYAELFAVMKDRDDYNRSHPNDVQGGINQLRKTAAALDRMAPPDVVAEDHNELRALYREAADDGDKMVAAIRARDRDAALALEPKLRRDNERQEQLLNQITRKLQAAEGSP